MRYSGMLVALGLSFLMSVRCIKSQPQPVVHDPKQGYAPLIESLAVFHTAVLGDSVKIDRCSVIQATGDKGILSRLTPLASAKLTAARDCEKNPGAQEANWRGLVSIKSYDDSAIVQMEAKDGHYVHLATYRAIKPMSSGRLNFVSVTLTNFGFSGSVPPSAPKPRPPA
jgi:hypothetical protein